jgi:hypothetical protein
LWALGHADNPGRKFTPFVRGLCHLRRRFSTELAALLNASDAAR